MNKYKAVVVVVMVVVVVVVVAQYHSRLCYDTATHLSCSCSSCHGSCSSSSCMSVSVGHVQGLAGTMTETFCQSSLINLQSSFSGTPTTGGLTNLTADLGSHTSYYYLY